jgi:excisionase family DNA binding protein
MQSDIESALIGISHLAERLGLSRRTIHRILARGELPSLRIGHRRLVRLSELRHWLDGHEVPSHGAKVINLNRQFVERAAPR